MRGIKGASTRVIDYAIDEAILRVTVRENGVGEQWEFTGGHVVVPIG
jgi:hypothetical protein